MAAIYFSYPHTHTHTHTHNRIQFSRREWVFPTDRTIQLLPKFSSDDSETKIGSAEKNNDRQFPCLLIDFSTILHLIVMHQHGIFYVCFFFLLQAHD